MIILISAANADVCLSMARILKAHDFYGKARLVGLTPDRPWPALQYFDEVLPISMANDPAYEAALFDVIGKIKPDIFIPFSEAELAWFTAHPDALGKLDTKVIINSPAVLNVFLDKQKTADFLKEFNVSVPKTVAPDNIVESDLPVIMKPRCSAGSKNMAIIRNPSQLAGFLDQHKGHLPSFVAQELIDVADAEFTCGVWRGGDVLRYCTFRRQLQGGMTGFAQVEQHPAIDRVLENIAGAIEGDFFINVQLRLRENVPYVFEINPRFSSTVMMRHKIGFQDFIWALDQKFDRLKIPLWQAPVSTMIFRVSDECVVNPKGEMI